MVTFWCPDINCGHTGLGTTDPSAILHSSKPVLSLGMGGGQVLCGRTAPVRPPVCGAAWVMDHPLLIRSLLFTPPDRLTQKARLARPAPSVGGTGEDEGINFWPADSGTACQSRPGNLVPFLCWLGASAQEWIKQGNSAWRTLPLGAAIPLSPESDSRWWSQHTPLHWHVPRIEQLPCSWKEGFVKKKKSLSWKEDREMEAKLWLAC